MTSDNEAVSHYLPVSNILTVSIFVVLREITAQAYLALLRN